VTIVFWNCNAEYTRILVAESGLRFARLDKHRYACGKEYFENEGRLFPNISLYLEGRIGSDSTWVVHNNWIVSYESKVYRFKEHFMWFVDKGKGGSMSYQYLATFKIVARN
jgi:hypothetical protein